MLVSFESLPADARVWIYQSQRALSTSEEERLRVMLEKFLLGWNSHGMDIHASFVIKHSRFVVIAADESKTGASGCSIDKVVHLITEAGTMLGLDLMDRKICYQDEGVIKSAELTQIKNLVMVGQIKENTLLFNNFISQKHELASKWIQRAADTWTAKYFSTSQVASML